MPRVHLSIGSNLGDRIDNIGRAIALWRQSPGLVSADGAVRVSSPLMSDPWGFDSVNGFVNVGISFETGLSPREVLTGCRAVEKAIDGRSHRRDDGSYADRVIDIDIIFYGSRSIVEDDLEIPHRLMSQREFVLRPLAEIDGGWIHPVLGLSARSLLSRLTGE